MIIIDKVKIAIKNLYWEFYEKRQFIYKEPHCLNKNKGIVIIKRDTMAGLFSYVEIVMRQTALAIENNLYPYVDMRGCTNPYQDLKDSEDNNWWELYFEQPVDDALPDAQKTSITLIDSNCKEVPHSREAVLYKKNRYYWGSIYEKHFRLNRRSEEYFLREYKEYFEDGRIKVLGVLIRGTDYNGAKGHPIQPSVNQVISEIKKIVHKYDKIYVASDERKNVMRLESEFPEKVIVNKRHYFDGLVGPNASINEVSFDRENDGYLKGLEYLSSVMLLSRCDGLIGGICGGSVAATYINNNKYKDFKLFYLGVQK